MHGMRHALLAVTFVTTTSAHSAVILADDFDGNAVGLERTPSGWRVHDGSVDLKGPGLDPHLCAGPGVCVDLDGSSNDAGVLEREIDLLGGFDYRLSFLLAGNRRLSGNETGVVRFGTASLAYLLTDRQTDYVDYELRFLPSVSGRYSVSFANDGGDNGGAILDQVRITRQDVDAPSALAAFGMAGAWLLGRRRRDQRG